MLQNKEPSPSSSQSRCAAATPAAATPPSFMLAMPAALAACAAPLPLSQPSAASLAAAAAAAAVAAGREPTPAEEQRYEHVFHFLADERQGSELPGVSLLRLLELLRQLGPDAPNGTADADAPMEQQAFCDACRSPWHAHVCVCTWRASLT